MRYLALLAAACAILAAVDAVDPCKRQPFRGRCPSKNGESPKRSQFVLRYYMRSGECVSYPYGHCANDESEPQLYRYKEECEDACINPPPGSQLNLRPRLQEFVRKSDRSLIISTSECERRRAHAAVTSIRGGFVPVCTAQGDFEKVQCEPDGRQCFCVDARGLEIANSRTRNGRKPDCNSIQSASTPRTKDCVGGAVRGPCSGSLDRWYYDEDEAECKGEPLKTKLGVAVNCAKSDCPSGYKCSVVQQSSVCCPENNKIIGLQMSGSDDVCSLPKDRGPCDKYELRFYFNAELKECKYFFWGGCEGNGNNFEKVEECESTCGIIKVKQSMPITTRTTPTVTIGRQPSFSFKTTQGIRITPSNRPKVEELTTLGKLVDQQSTIALSRTSVATSISTGATAATATTATVPVGVLSTGSSTLQLANKLSTEAKVVAPVVHVTYTRAPPIPEMSLLEGSEDNTADGVNRCLHPRDPGNCRGQFVRWYWDNENKVCDVFTYTGCQGNGNNYASREECLAICHKEVALSPGNLCEHDIEVGECSGVFVRFGYDKLTNDCRQFTYGGCGGKQWQQFCDSTRMSECVREEIVQSKSTV
ncbi:unnamed protein product [Angiostrongylus costaricensis]|uniref:Kunitz/Bovine pancreatic trypsin inhibitor domain protein n=1 Tax=Angiostrongylus costaricensis TaxID=334426 RepID=A0A158PLT3_ANGCS|nr:unnamed protein product [Angiostrongylus costaricensis]